MFMIDPFVPRTEGGDKGGGYTDADGADPDYLRDLPNYNKNKEVH